MIASLEAMRQGKPRYRNLPSLTPPSHTSPTPLQKKTIPSEAELPCHIPQPARRGRQPPTPIRQSRTSSSANRVRFKTRDFHHCQRIVYCSAGRGSAEMHCRDSGHAEMMRRVHMNGRPGRSLCIRIKRASYLSTASKQSRARACADTTTPPPVHWQQQALHLSLPPSP